MGTLYEGGSARLAAVLARLAVLIDWERRDRSALALQSMRVDTGPARALCALVGAWPLPADARRPVVVHVAGSKGKGSVAALVEVALASAGWRVGRYGSPHVERLSERFVIEGREVDDGHLAAALEEVMDARDGALGPDSAVAASTWFDVLTAAAFLLFARADLDAWVVECGLGGRLDSTNVLTGDVAVITNIELEHTAILGATRGEIAAEKAGIFKAGARAVVGLMAPDRPGGRPELGQGERDPASEAVARIAAALGLPTVWRPKVRAESFDQHNRALAGAVLDALGSGGQRDRAGAALGAHVVQALPPGAGRLPGRCERLTVAGVPVVLDGAHVATSLGALLDQLEGDPTLPGPPVVVLGMGKDKDADALLKCLVGRVDSVLCSSAGVGPYLAPEVLATKAQALGLETQTVPDPRRAVQIALGAASGRWVLVTGSLHLVGAVRPSLLQPAHPGSPC